MRYCPECGRASCGTCGRRPPTLRRDTQQVARATGGSAGGWFWGILLVIGVLFWPNIFVHGPHRMACEIGWYSFLGAVVLLVLICAFAANRPESPPLPPAPPEPVPPVTDLRFSREFEGIW